MLDLNCIQTFLAVVECGGFRLAGQQIGISQSAVTQHLKRLEHTLNVSLIERKNSRCGLTHEGTVFLPYAKNLIAMSARTSNLFKREILTVGASSNIGIYSLQPYLSRYQELKESKLDVVISNNIEIAKKLTNFELDIALMEWWDHRPGFVSRVWRTDELVLIVPKTHPLAEMDAIPPAYLYGTKLLGGEPGTGTGRLIEEYFGTHANSIGISIQLGSTEAVKHAVQAGLGMSLVLATAVEQERAAGSLAVLAIQSENRLLKHFMAVQRVSEITEHSQTRKFMAILFEGSEVVPVFRTVG